MSNKEMNQVQDFSKYDTMRTEALAALLQADLLRPAEEQLSYEELLYISNVYSSRSDAAVFQKSAEDAFAEFKTHYLPVEPGEVARQQAQEEADLQQTLACLQQLSQPKQNPPRAKLRRPSFRKCLVIAAMMAVLLSLMILPANACGVFYAHDWQPATCSIPERCTDCQATKGEPLGHVWTDATCQKPQTCSVCNLQEGSALLHTSDGNRSCTVCKESLPVVVTYDTRDTQTTRLVYDGVILQTGNNPYNSGYMRDFAIYDESGALVAQGEWPQQISYAESSFRTDFIPLEPGNYLVHYRMYADVIYVNQVETDEQNNHTWEVVCRPYGDLLSRTFPLRVR